MDIKIVLRKAFEARGVDEVKQEVGEILRPIFVQFHRNSEH